MNTTDIVPQNPSLDFESLVNRWLELEQSGEKFPANFETVWQMIGYSTKGNAKRALPKAYQGELFIITNDKNSGRGRPKQVIKLSCDGVKHLCLMAETEEGHAIRQYFIEAEKNWRLVQQQAPQFAQEIELLKLRNESLKLESQKHQAELALMQFRHNIVSFCPEPIQQKILGYQVVEKTEVIEKVIDRATGDESDAVGITYVAKALGFKTTKQAWGFLERIGYGKESGHWKSELSAVYHAKLPREVFHEILDRFPDDDRQLFLGE